MLGAFASLREKLHLIIELVIMIVYDKKLKFGTEIKYVETIHPVHFKQLQGKRI